ncbi:NAD+ synthase [Candidatus Finniella inopinata]|uniref:Glutamine-dependent NAD(+) synthetase n=1 Tax=Candidatus Finniella inopinata TaxID=1696036 RepID=A0A4Q7DL13_9PROT|nr:NAD+ synthase [Candidatus Finniella inopinata]RZI47098.1 NAD+ synthase [Candidatus Finniella inopinata]
MTTIGLCQINPWVGHLQYNLEKIKQHFVLCQQQDVDLVVFPECAITGYPLEDLVLKPYFLQKVEQTIHDLAAVTIGSPTAILLGSPWLQAGKIVNTAMLIEDGKIQHIILKHKLPNHGVFDEKRIFQPGPLPTPILFRGLQLGVMVCEDMWYPEPAQHLKQNGAEILVVLNGSPFDLTKHERRQNQAKERVADTGLPLIYLNMVGGQDHLVFDGQSFVMATDQTYALEMPAFQETVGFIKLEKEETVAVNPLQNLPKSSMNEAETIYHCLVMGLKDYVEKNDFKGVLIGLSGGIDSALVAAIAVDALGAERVQCVMMPSPYTSKASFDDAESIVQFLKTPYDILSIEPAMAAYEQILQDTFADKTADTTEENIQSRSRGMVLMAMSNKNGFMVLSTGNKSEMAVGYATLYGDMCGGYNPLKDLYKMQVFSLAKWRNENSHSGFLGPDGPVMPDSVITKPPSAELKPDQTDQDSLPAYEVLDAILHQLIEKKASIQDVVANGFREDEVIKVYHLLHRAEYKRRQSPPGPKVSTKALSAERRYPITNGFLLNL